MSGPGTSRGAEASDPCEAEARDPRGGRRDGGPHGSPETVTVAAGHWDELVRRAALLIAAPPLAAAEAARAAEARKTAGGTAAAAASGYGRRRLLGIAGAPGAGKSTLAGYLVKAFATAAVLVPMDGFHLAEAELHRLGRHERKGAIDTFDAYGYLALLRRLRDDRSAVVYAPEFRREIEEPIAGAIPVPPAIPLVITEGNYLLVDDGPWAQVRALLEEVWFLEVDEEVRLGRLTDRHMSYGRPAGEAYARARGTDQRNAELIAATRDRADLIIRMS